MPIRVKKILAIRRPTRRRFRFSDAVINRIRASASRVDPLGRPVLDRENCAASEQLSLEELVSRVVALAQTLSERQFYNYQVELAWRITESLLLHDGDVITALMARQMGKTETIGAIVAAIAVIFPELAKRFPKSWHLNITDDRGVYRGFRDGVKIGIYAPRLDQSEIMFERAKRCLETDTAARVLKELGVSLLINNGNTISLSNGSRVLCESASEQSKIEGETHHLLVCEECQDITDIKIRKSLHPMVSAYNGTIVKVGTATTQRCDFYNSIKTNERAELNTGTRNHFFFPYTVGLKFNSLYRKYIEKEIVRLGETSDEFRTSYAGEWIFERGMFITQEALFSREVAHTNGIFSLTHPRGLPALFKGYSVVAGIDWGQSYDSTVLTLMAVNWNAPIDSGYYEDAEGQHSFTYYHKHVIDWFEMLGDDYEYQFNEIYRRLQEVRGLAKIVTDSNTCGRPIYDRLCSVFTNKGIEVEPFNFQPKLKSDGYKLLAGDLSGKRVTFPCNQIVARSLEHRKFLAQMLELRKEYKNGLMSVAHPNEKGAHDDFPDSLMMANWGAGTPSRSGFLEFSRDNFFYNK